MVIFALGGACSKLYFGASMPELSTDFFNELKLVFSPVCCDGTCSGVGSFLSAPNPRL